MTGSTLGAVFGGLLGGAYLAGGMAQAAAQHQRVTKLADVASGGYADEDLQRVVDRMDDSALSIARRHDPYVSAGSAQRDRQAALFAARLEAHGAGANSETQNPPMLLRASLGGAFNPAARPFRLGGALEESRDLECLTQAVYYEARGETPAGQAAVAQVVLNRARHPAFPKSICGVVFQGAYGAGACQFSFACDGSMRKRREPGAWQRAERVAAKALSGAVMNTVGTATHFHTVNVSPGWGPRLVRVGQVGLHIFYRFGGRPGAPDSFDRTPDRSGPGIGDRPIYASASKPEGPVPYASLQPAKDAVFIAATAMKAPVIELVEGGVGGQAGKAPEPASAPKPAKPAKAEDAATKTEASTGAAS
ncbi:cell wall hydrolase [Caulobacter mirabilis]|uniref:cell wall hydrolase n=1 Tax=Caulobacter mirabilis TaxID=69666 RepID=UPI001FEC8EE9|nr:cell wall hydrolase [Caulobacter mirabilis]